MFKVNSLVSLIPVVLKICDPQRKLSQSHFSQDTSVCSLNISMTVQKYNITYYQHRLSIPVLYIWLFVHILHSTWRYTFIIQSLEAVEMMLLPRLLSKEWLVHQYCNVWSNRAFTFNPRYKVPGSLLRLQYPLTLVYRNSLSGDNKMAVDIPFINNNFVGQNFTFITAMSINTNIV